MEKLKAKIEETVISLLDWAQNQIPDGITLLEGEHPLPAVLEGCARLIEVMDARFVETNPRFVVETLQKPLSKVALELSEEARQRAKAYDVGETFYGSLTTPDKQKETGLYDLRIEDGKLLLDDKYVKGLTGYEVKKGSVEGATELFLRLIVNR